MSIFSLPQAVRYHIYGLLGSDLSIRIELDKYSCLKLHDGAILRSAKRVREDIVRGHRKGRCEIICIISDPAVLKSAAVSYYWLYAAPAPKVISIILLNKRTMNTADFDETAEAWRKTFNSLPTDIGEATKTVLFDFMPSFPTHLLPRVAKLLNILSAVLRHRTGGRTSCKITGCGNEKER